MTIPNILTLSRIFLTPFLVWFLHHDMLNYALIVFLIAGLTDGLDGLIARMFHQKSQLGAYMDPLADKLLLVTSFVFLGYQGLIPDWLVIVAVSRDAMIVLGLATLKFHNVPVRIKPVFSSKLTTLMQLITVLLALSSTLVPLPSWLYMIVFIVTAGFAVYSGARYVMIGTSLLGMRQANNEGK
ncbi:MAG: CDP-alcohol phosphatidyltransferase family protein [Acidobacteriota bacterium]